MDKFWVITITTLTVFFTNGECLAIHCYVQGRQMRLGLGIAKHTLKKITSFSHVLSLIFFDQCTVK